MNTKATEHPIRRYKPPPSRLAMHIGAVLAAARGERGLREVARAAPMKHVNLLRLERGEENPTLARVEQWAAALGGRLEVRFVPDDAEQGDA
jgi:transcriptional regulator with XRE-family HTH domain